YSRLRPGPQARSERRRRHQKSRYGCDKEKQLMCKSFRGPPKAVSIFHQVLALDVLVTASPPPVSPRYEQRTFSLQRRPPWGNFRHRDIHDRAFGMITSAKRWAPRG